jgi:hypothetical protein
VNFNVRGLLKSLSESLQRVHDVLLVSSFALWATLLGFVPLATYRLLMG